MVSGGTKPLEIASDWRQFCMLTWKNLILIRRNLLGTLFELALSIFFVCTLLIIRHIVERIYVPEQIYPAYYIIDYFQNAVGHNLILFYPNNSMIQQVVQHAYNLIKSRKLWLNLSIQGTDIANASSLDQSTIQKLVAHISFPPTYETAFPDNVEYTIHTQEQTTYEYRVDTTFYDKAEYMFSKQPEYFCFENRYFRTYNTFNSIKHAVDMSLVQYISGVPLTDARRVKIKQFDCPEYYKDEMKSSFSFINALIIEIAFLFTLLMNVGNMVLEKQTKMKDYLAIVGIKWYISWLTNMLRSFLVYFILSILITAIGTIELKPRIIDPYFANKILFERTHFTVIFLTCIVYSIQVTTFTLLIAQLFNRPFIAKILSILIWLITALNFYDSLPSTNYKYMFCLFPNSALNFAFQIIFQYERSKGNLYLWNLFENLFDDPLNLGTILILMLFWSFLYLPLTWYIEKIMPGQFGIPLPFYFIVSPSYWFGSQQRGKKNLFDYQVEMDENLFERMPKDAEPLVKFINVSKTFDSGKKKNAVENLTVDLYENQITGLLGHNGAGKSTSIFMLCGIYPPSDGKIQIFGYDVGTQMNKIRSSIGFCPQISILYDDLTVYEHLYLISAIKGFRGDSIREEVNKICAQVGLERDMSKKSKNLSGGMKRRLSLAMALTGDSKVIILDEPTSGLDPYNRRLLWTLIQKNKFNRTIILTTHFMEEADVLCDRIAIMNHGKIKCCGTPLFLKKAFGQNFRLLIYKNESFNEMVFTNILNTFFTDYAVETNIATELCIGLCVKSNGLLADLLRVLEESKQMIGIENYGVSSTTIEEVFLKFGQIKDDFEAEKSIATEKTFKMSDFSLLSEESSIVENEHLSSVFNKELIINYGMSRIVQQLVALTTKRLRMFVGRKFLAVVILFLPMILQCIFCLIIPSQTYLINQFSGKVQSKGTYKLDIANYGSFRLPYTLNGSYSLIPVKSLFNNFYTSTYRPGVELVDVVASNVSDYVFQRRKSDVRYLAKDFYVGMSLNISDWQKLYGTVYYSTLALHSSAIAVNEIANLYLAFLTKDYQKSIVTYNSPLTANDSLYNGDDFLEYLACMDVLPVSLFNMLNSVIVAFVVSALVIHVSRERINGSKYIQFLTGTHYVTYWLANYIFDLAVCFFNLSSMIVTLKVIDLIKNDPTNETSPIASNNSIFYVFLLFFASSFSWCSLAYIWSFFFKSDIIGFILLAIILGVAGFLDMIWSLLYLFLKLDQFNKKSYLITLMNNLRYLFLYLFPNVSIKRGLYNIKIRKNSYCIRSLNTILGTDYKFDEPMLSFNEPGIGFIIFVCLVQFACGNFILFLFEYKNRFNFDPIVNKLLSIVNRKNKYVEQENEIEEDIKSESDRIEFNDVDQLVKSEPLVVKNLIKNYRRGSKLFCAVNRLNFGIKKGECFGLLGLNGAGKTTLLQMLIGELKSTNGQIFINGFNYNKNYSKARQNLGYCPQFSYLPEFLNVEECLELFADLRGIHRLSTLEILDDLIKLFKLDRFKKRKIQHLSEGNKRKLSAALSFLGKPQVVILDEPTTGMDPASRRYFWNLIKKARSFGITIILSSHSMEECEALCSKLAIMANGQFKTLGTSKYIKSKYGKGFSIIIKCQREVEPSNECAILESFITKSISNSSIKERQQEALVVQVDYDKKSDLKKQSIADLFNFVENLKEKFNIETYSVSETTLEQIFLYLANSKKSTCSSSQNLTLDTSLERFDFDDLTTTQFTH